MYLDVVHVSYLGVRSNQDLCSYEMVRLVQFSRFWLALLSEVTYSQVQKEPATLFLFSTVLLVKSDCS